MKCLPLYFGAVMLCVACSVSHPDVPSHYADTDSLPCLYPDYTEVTVPANIAPLNFMVCDTSVVECVAEFGYPGGSRTYGNGRKVVIDETEWREILASARGQELKVRLYTQTAHEGWRRHPVFSIQIAADSIDPWLSYRLIEPLYVSWGRIDIMQRNLTSFEESVICSNENNQNQCVNCHSYQNYRTENMLFHVRGKGGGTMLVYRNEWKLMQRMRREGMISNPVYPAWHPELPLIAFSTNVTGQFFHTQDTEKVEVQDSRSELVLYEVESDKMIRIPSDSADFETFPTWTPDGRQLYYCSARFERHDTAVTVDREAANRYKDFHYDIYVRDFNPDSLTFGPRRLVLDEAAYGRSASLPRVSPDGKYLVFASGRYGCFHIWHKDADIHLLDLATAQVDTLPTLNSQRAESYPSWSSNGRWIVMASRRDDGNYSRVYISYFDAQGKARKAFAVPQADPEHDRLLLRSYNRPETMLEPVRSRN